LPSFFACLKVSPTALDAFDNEAVNSSVFDVPNNSGKLLFKSALADENSSVSFVKARITLTAGEYLSKKSPTTLNLEKKKKKNELMN